MHTPQHNLLRYSSSNPTLPYLCVAEEEDHLIALQTSLQKDVPDVIPPLLHTVVLGQLNLKAVILCPAHVYREREGYQWEEEGMYDVYKCEMRVRRWCEA